MGHSLARFALLTALVVAALAILPVKGDRHVANACGQAGPFGFDTYEARDNVGLYGQAIELATAGLTFPGPVGVSGGEQAHLNWTGLNTGPRGNRTPGPDRSQRIPPSLFKAIAWIESGWANASHSTPWGGVGPALRSFDCGFGLGQVTSGMANSTGNASAKQAAVGTHFLFNLAESVNILASKWNTEYRPIAGEGNPAHLEDWYYAVWSYNGFAAVNHPAGDVDHELEWSEHPLNPWRDPLRGEVYHCGDPNAPNFDFTAPGDFTYPERIYGCMRFPPRHTPEPGEFGYVDPSTLAAGTGAVTAAQNQEFPPTATPVANGSETPAPLVTGTPTPAPPETPTVPATAAADATPDATSTASATATANVLDEPLVPWWYPDADGRVRMYQPQAFHMPDFSIPEIAEAFDPQHFIDCENGGFGSGCPEMDFPTAIEEFDIVPHTDTAAGNAPQTSSLIGSPNLVILGEPTADLVAYSDGSASGVIVTVVNTGSWIGPFRIRTSAPWLVVRHPDDALSRVMHGGVAVGSETEIVVVSGNSQRQAVTQFGYDSVLQITLDPSVMPGGISQGSVWIEPLLGGAPVEITVVAENGEVRMPYNLIVPALSSHPIP